MRRVLTAAVVALGVLPAAPASASCVPPGLGVARPWARPGEAVRFFAAGGRGAQCEVSTAPGTPVTVIDVTLYLSRPGERVTLLRFTQRGYGHDGTARIPAGTARGLWTLRTDSGLRAEGRFRVGEPPLLPRTGGPAAAPLAAAGAWLVVAGSYAFAAGSRTRRA